jgi:hypothetical protein
VSDEVVEVGSAEKRAGSLTIRLVARRAAHDESGAGSFADCKFTAIAVHAVSLTRPRDLLTKCAPRLTQTPRDSDGAPKLTQQSAQRTVCLADRRKI